MKNAGAISWSDVDSGEAALIARCAAGDEVACAELVATHQRMVYGLALNLLGDRDEALDLSQEVFLRVFRTLSQLSRPVGAPHLDLPHRRQPGTQPQRWWRRRHRASRSRSTSTPAVRRPGVEAGRPAGPAAGQQGNGRADLAGAGAAAVRSAHRADPARGRRPALRRDRLLARRGGRHREVAADARAPGAARRAAGAAVMIPYLGCDAAREMLQAFVDGELPMAEQVALEAHLRWCETCRARVEDMRLDRRGAPPGCGGPGRACRGSRGALAAIQSDVLTRIRAERDQSLAVALPRAVRRHALSLAGARRHGRAGDVPLRRDECQPESLAPSIRIRWRIGLRPWPTRARIAIRCSSTRGCWRRGRSIDGSALDSIPEEEAVFAWRRS